MSVQSDIRAILFADICDSTRLYHELGDDVAHALTAQCLKCVKDATARHEGLVIKTTGDGAMTAFPTVELAYRAAANIQLALRTGPLRVKIGFHMGPVIVADGDVFGNTVNLAARVLARSGPGEILMTRACVEKLNPLLRATVRLLDTAMSKGKGDPLEIYRVIGERNDETTIPSSAAAEELDSGLVLSYQGQTMFMTATDSPLLIGRDARCRLIVTDESSSRHHATIEVQHNGFVLTDRSTNGTFLVDRNGNEQFLRRESALLSASGIISIGVAPDENKGGLIQYRNEGAAAVCDSAQVAERPFTTGAAPGLFTATIGNHAQQQYQSWH